MEIRTDKSKAHLQVLPRSQEPGGGNIARHTLKGLPISWPMGLPRSRLIGLPIRWSSSLLRSQQRFYQSRMSREQPWCQADGHQCGLPTTISESSSSNTSRPLPDDNCLQDMFCIALAAQACLNLVNITILEKLTCKMSTNETTRNWCIRLKPTSGAGCRSIGQVQWYLMLLVEKWRGCGRNRVSERRRWRETRRWYKKAARWWRCNWVRWGSGLRCCDIRWYGMVVLIRSCAGGV